MKEKIEILTGKKMTAFGIEYPFIEALAVKFGIGTSTLKDRNRRQGLNVEAAVELPLGGTSHRNTRVP